jgi:phosphohistidine phosphatase SixA
MVVVMLLIMITHAEARLVKPDYIYRGLTDIGREQVKVAAAEFRKALPSIGEKLGGNLQEIERIISAPMARCVETVMLFADELRDLTKTSEISVNDHLKENRGEQLKTGELVAALEGVKEGVILIGARADLGGALPPSTRLIDGVVDDKGFFKSCPVLVVVDYQPDKWESARVLYCQAYKDSPMKNWLAPLPVTDK